MPQYPLLLNMCFFRLYIPPQEGPWRYNSPSFMWKTLTGLHRALTPKPHPSPLGWKPAVSRPKWPSISDLMLLWLDGSLQPGSDRKPVIAADLCQKVVEWLQQSHTLYSYTSFKNGPTNRVQDRQEMKILWEISIETLVKLIFVIAKIRIITNIFTSIFIYSNNKPETVCKNPAYQSYTETNKPTQLTNHQQKAHGALGCSGPAWLDARVHCYDPTWPKALGIDSR